MTSTTYRGSSSLRQPEYWWYRARAQLLRASLAEYVGDSTSLLDVGSADGPSVGWLHGRRHVQVDLDPRGLRAGTGVCASALALPFEDASFDVVGAFDVLEHCDPEDTAVSEFVRVLAPHGRLLLAVPAYQWAWSPHDDRAGHVRRYTRRRLLHALDGHGLEIKRCSHIFAGTFPFFAAQRVATRVRRESDTGSLPAVSARVERILLGLSHAEERLVARHDLPFGSSIVVAAVKTGRRETR